jgi:hypothetical protein
LLKETISRKNFWATYARTGYDYLYFAYGSNMDWETIAHRAPGAKYVDVAYIEGWELSFATTGAHLNGRGAAISTAAGSTVLRIGVADH